MRSGRVKLEMDEEKTIIYVPSGSSAIRYYRIYNSGKNKVQPITITGADGHASVTLPAHESVDFGVKNADIKVKAHLNESAEVIYDYLG